MYPRVNEPHLTHRALLLPQSSPPSPPTDTSSGPGTNDRWGKRVREQGEGLDTAQISWLSFRSPVALLVDAIFTTLRPSRSLQEDVPPTKQRPYPTPTGIWARGILGIPFVLQVLSTVCDRN